MKHEPKANPSVNDAAPDDQTSVELDDTQLDAVVGGTMMSDLIAQNQQLLDLQSSVQQESRRYQTLSNASKARHDIAMHAIRNTRA